ncbi:tetratricopeptide repeat protein [Amycolatopsis lurida]
MAQRNAFAMELKQCLQERKNELSQATLADMVHVSPGYLSKVVNGRRPAPTDLARKIDGVLGTRGRFERLAAAEQAIDEFVSIQPRQLPALVADFVGRRPALSQLEAKWAARAAPGSAKVVVVEGAPGIGKSALILRFAATIAHRYDGGCLYADLRLDDRTPEVVLDGFLLALGVPATLRPTTLDGKAALFRSALAQRRILMVLDNASANDQLLPLLPGSSGAVLVSMRTHVPEFYERTGASSIVLGPFGTAESRELLAVVAGGSRVAAEPAAVQQLVRTCGGFPGAVRQAGELLVAHPHRPLHELADQLESGDQLDELDRLRTSFSQAYEELHPSAARLFRLLGSHTAGPMTEPAIVALSGIESDAARRALDDLRAGHLIDEADGRIDPPGPLKTFAAECAHTRDDNELAQARSRLFRWYLEEAATANDALAPDWDGAALLGRPPASTMTFREAMSWCAAEAETVLRLARCAKREGDNEMAWKLTLAYMPFLYLSKRWDIWLHAASVGVSAAREAADLKGLGRCLHSLGWVLYELGKADEALRHLCEGVRLQEHLGDDRGRAWTMLGIGATNVSRRDHVAAREALQASAKLFLETGLGFGAVVAMSYEASVLVSEKAFGEALDLLLRALEVAVSTGVRPTEGLVRHGLGELHLAREEFQAALTQFDRALLLRRETGQQWAEAEAQVGRGNAWVGLGEGEHARSAFKSALAIYERLRDPRGLDVRALLASLGSV